MLKHLCRIALIGSFTAIATAGQVSTDGTMGAAQTLTGPNYTIAQDLGTTVGNNLFHSFGTFNLSQGDVATFTGANTIQNVISRVTDGNPSSIDGTIESQVGNANFFFINPAGVVFGQHAVVDVPAAFHASTANELRFADGTAYNLVTPKGSLTAASPEAFGFLGATGDIVIENSQLHFREGTEVSFTGGSVTSNNATIEVPRGSLRVYGNGNAVSKVPINGDLPVGNGEITVNGGKWDVSGNGGGNIWISGGDVNMINESYISNWNTGSQNATGALRIVANTLLIDYGTITTDALSSGYAGNIIINVNGVMQVLNESWISSDTLGSGDAGMISITSETLTIDYSWISSVSEYISGNAGDIFIHVNGAMQVLNESWIFNNTSGSANAGMISITAETLTIEYSEITSNADTGSTGNAGVIIIEVNGDMQVLYESFISSNTSLSGDGGEINIIAGTLYIDASYISSNANSRSTGNAGDIFIHVNGAMLLNESTISSNTSKSEGAGSVRVLVSGPLFISKGSISTISKIGNGGDITITAPAIVLNNGQITTSVLGDTETGQGGGNGGDITLNGGYLVLDTGFIQANTAGEDAQGGNIFINMDGMLSNGGVTEVGGRDRATFVRNSGKNVIQAAAPGGESGNITFSNPNNDTASSIGANSNRLEPIKLAKHPCEGIKGRFNFRRRGDVGLPNSGEDIIQPKQPVKIDNAAASRSKQLSEPSVCQTIN